MDKPVPVGIALTPFDEHYREHPYAVLADVRERAPVMRDEAFKRWFVSTHDEVKRVLRDTAMWSDPRKGAPESFERTFLARDDREPSMLFMDDPGHRRVRGLINKAFTPKAVEAQRPRIRAIAQALLAEVDAAPCTFDLMARFAAPFPVIVIAEMLGIDPARHDDFKRWSDASVAAFFNPFRSEEEAQRSLEAQQALDDFFMDAIAQRRKAPNADLISSMTTVTEGGDRFTDEEIVSQCNLLLIAGNVTTTDLIGNGVRALIDHPEQMALLRAKPGLIANAVEEMLRFDSPVTTSGRIANRDMPIGGCPVTQGQSVNVSLASANRDPSIYPDPDRFDVEREDTHHQSFGGGRHFCLGAPLARIEAQEGVIALLERFEHLTASARGHSYRTIPGFRGFSEYWLDAR